MVPILEFKDYFLGLKTRITDITRVEFVIKEDHIASIIKQITQKEIALIVVIPSANADAMDEDNFGDINSTLLYVFSPANKSADTQDKMLQRLAATQSVMEQIKTILKQDKSNTDSLNLMTLLNIPSMHTDPEYDFLGCDGWSLMFNFKTNEF